MMLFSTRMWKHLLSALPVAALALLVSAATLLAQSAPPTMPDHTVLGRLGTGTGSGPAQAITFRQTFTTVTNPSILVTTPTNSLVQGINIAMSGSQTGSTAGTSTTCQSQGQNSFAYNLICITQDALNVTAGNPPFTYGQSVGFVTGGANSQGTKVALGVQLLHNLASAASLPRDNIGFSAGCIRQAREGGTNTGAGSAGDCFGINPGVHLLSGA